MNCRITETDYSLKVTLLLSANQIFPSPLPDPSIFVHQWKYEHKHADMGAPVHLPS